MKASIAIWVASALILGGTLALVYAQILPVYTDESAPARLSVELMDLPRQERFSEWQTQIRTFETKHKVIADTARGSISLGIAIFLSIGILWLYHKGRWFRKKISFVLVWVSLWLIQIPFIFWYYGLRQKRFDYPAWGDSIAIPIYSNVIMVIAGTVLGTAVLSVLLFKRRLTGRLNWERPGTILNWIRNVLLILWMLVLVGIVAISVAGGDEGMVLSCSIAIPILWIVLNAEAMHGTILLEETKAV